MTTDAGTPVVTTAIAGSSAVGMMVAGIIEAKMVRSHAIHAKMEINLDLVTVRTTDGIPVGTTVIETVPKTVEMMIVGIIRDAIGQITTEKNGVTPVLMIAEAAVSRDLVVTTGESVLVTVRTTDGITVAKMVTVAVVLVATSPEVIITGIARISEDVMVTMVHVERTTDIRIPALAGTTIAGVIKVETETVHARSGMIVAQDTIRAQMIAGHAAMTRGNAQATVRMIDGIIVAKTVIAIVVLVVMTNAAATRRASETITVKEPLTVDVPITAEETTKVAGGGTIIGIVAPKNRRSFPTDWKPVPTNLPCQTKSTWRNCPSP